MQGEPNIIDVRNIWRCLGLFALAIALFCTVSLSATAQTGNAGQLQKPSFTSDTINQALGALEEQSGLSDDQKAQLNRQYLTTLEALKNAENNIDKANGWKNRLKSADETLEKIQSDIEEMQATLLVERNSTETPMNQEALVKLEQNLIRSQNELRGLDASFESISTELQNLDTRQLAAPTELGNVQTRLSEILTQLTALGDGDLDIFDEASRKQLQAQRYSSQAQIIALEEEIAGLTAIIELTRENRNLTELRIRYLNEQIAFLQEKTGQRRLLDADYVLAAEKAVLDTLGERHPLVLDSATQNVIYGEEIVDLAKEADLISKLAASTRTQIDDVERDLKVAKQLLKLDDIDRRAGAALRQLANQLEPINSLKAAINRSNQAYIEVTQQKLLTEEILRDYPIRALDPEDVLAEARTLNPELPDFEPADIEVLKTLHDKRRVLLRQIFTQSTNLTSDRDELKTQQVELLRQTEDLNTLLSQNLLWVPSVPAINLEWPGQVIKGTLNLFSGTNFRLVQQVLGQQLPRQIPLTLFFSVLIILALLLRKTLWEDILRRSHFIGRVKQDHYLQSPAVIASCLILAAPVPLIFFWLAIIFARSQSPTPLIDGLVESFIFLGFFVLFFLTWRAMDREKSLFGTHYNLPATLRKGLNNHFRWFIPAAGIFAALTTLSEVIPDTEIYEGFSVFAFIVTSIILSLFFFRVLWRRRHEISDELSDNSFFRRNRGLPALLLIITPTAMAILAALGYYDTANEFLSRLFISGALVGVTYVVYGLIRRTVVIAQRRLALSQAIERREATLKARQEKLDAEARGEALMDPPPVDTDIIDITAISRQSLQLLNTLVVIGFTISLWLIWSNLLPALSIFDKVVLGAYETLELDANGRPIENIVTLWNLIQSVVIVGLAFIAARNLPGFLEIFVLSRTRADAGTRYAVVTVLGYIIIAVGIFYGFKRLGLQWKQLQWVVTGLSVGIGFGLQKIIANFISGLIILFERPIRLGDYVSIGDQNGFVRRIKIRATTLMDLDNREILIPNEALVSERMINWTLSSSINRIIIKVGIAYGSDTDFARDVMLRVLKDNPDILDHPEPNVLFLGFGDSSLDFEMRLYIKNIEDRYPISHSVHTEINKALENAGISIPFPQRDLHMITQQQKNPVKPKLKKT